MVLEKTRESLGLQGDPTSPLLFLYWTRTWWSGVNDERVKKGKKLIFPGLCSRLSHSRESARNTEIEREKERKEERKKERNRKKDRHGDPSSVGAKVF